MGWVSGQAYSDDLRSRVLGAVDRGGRVYEIAPLFEVSVSYIYKALARRRLHGIETALPKTGRPGRKLDRHIEALAAHVAANPDASSGRTRRVVAARARRRRVCRHDVGNARSARPVGEKKTCHAAEQERADVAAARAEWRETQGSLSIDRLVFIDETWAATSMTRRYGRSKRGTRLVASVPHGHWKTTTFIGALRADGLTAPAVFDGAINGEQLPAYVQQVLVPTLKPGDIVILDNLSSHKVEGVRRAHRGGRRRDPPPAALLARPQSHRTDVCQAQGAAAQDRRPLRRSPLDRHRPARQRL